MKIKTVLAFAVSLVGAVAALNFLLNNVRFLGSLPENRVEQARREALQKPFYEREHRLERKPRLESAVSKEARKSLEAAEDVRAAASDAVKNTMEKGVTGALTDEAHMNLKSDEAMRRERIQAQQNNADIGNLGNGGSAMKHLRGSQKQQQADRNEKLETTAAQRNKYHVIPSVDGQLYTEWQVRLCYYWYKQMKTQHPNSAMGGFTRLLHSGKEDNYMSEIPTVVVDPLPEGLDQGYPVLNRPYAFLQWVRKYMDDIPEDYVLMAEPDHIFVSPPPLWATPLRAAAYPFSYMKPGDHVKLINRFTQKGTDVNAIAPIGNSPVQIHKDQLRGMVETWYNLSMSFKKDPEADKAFGWILDMYAYGVASSQHEAGPIQYELHPELMAQPPFDPFLIIQGKPVHIVHLTYGMDYDQIGKMVYGQYGYWHFDKRDYRDKYPPRSFPSMPDNVDAPAIKYILSAMSEAFSHLSRPDATDSTI